MRYEKCCAVEIRAEVEEGGWHSVVPDQSKNRFWIVRNRSIPGRLEIHRKKRDVLSDAEPSPSPVNLSCVETNAQGVDWPRANRRVHPLVTTSSGL